MLFYFLMGLMKNVEQENEEKKWTKVDRKIQKHEIRCFNLLHFSVRRFSPNPFFTVKKMEPHIFNLKLMFTAPAKVTTMTFLKHHTLHILALGSHPKVTGIMCK